MDFEKKYDSYDLTFYISMIATLTFVIGAFIGFHSINLNDCQIETTYFYEDGTQGISLEKCNKNFTAFNPERTKVYKAEQKVIMGQ